MVQIKNVQRPSLNDWPEATKFDANNQHKPAAATAAVVTIAADADQPIILSQIFWSYSTAPTGGSVKVEDGAGNIVWGPHAIGAAGPNSITFVPPLHGTKNTAMVITLASGGGAVEGALSVNAWKEE